MFYVDSSLASPCLVNYVGIILGNGTLLSVCEKQHVAFVGDWLVGDSYETNLVNNSIKWNPTPVPELSSWCPAGTLTSCFFGNFIHIAFIYEYILEIFHFIRYPYCATNGSNFSCLSPCSLPLSLLLFLLLLSYFTCYPPVSVLPTLHCLWQLSILFSFLWSCICIS